MPSTGQRVQVRKSFLLSAYRRDFCRTEVLITGKRIFGLFRHGTPSVAGGGPETYAFAEQLSNPGGCNGGTCDWRIKTYRNANFNVWEVTLNNLTSFSSFFITTDNAAPLPVKLVQLGARVVEQSVVINWGTSEEMNSAGFDVQRSRNGKFWETLRTVAAYGESTGLQ